MLHGSGVLCRYGTLGFVQAENMVNTPVEDVDGGVHVGVHVCVALLALEHRLALTVFLRAMPALAACSGCVRRVDEDQPAVGGGLRLVFEFACDAAERGRA